MIRRWVTQVGNCEFVHKSHKYAIAYGNEKINVIEMIDLDTFKSDIYSAIDALNNKDGLTSKAYAREVRTKARKKLMDLLTMVGK